VLTATQLLIMETAQAFRGRPDMTVMASLEGITQAEAAWRPEPGMPSIEQIVRHIAWAKSRFCQRGFGTAMVIADESVNDDGDCAELPMEFPCGAGWGIKSDGDIAGAIRLLEEAHGNLTRCLEGISEEALEKTIPTHHGKTAANFFWVMLMHDIYHAGQIRTRRSMFRVFAGTSRWGDSLK